MQKPDERSQTKFLESLLRIYSPYGYEGELSDYLEATFNEFGFNKVRKGSSGSVFGEIGDGRGLLVLCGHFDTVPGILRVRMEDGRISGRGAVDAKASLAAMVMAALTVAADLPTRVIVIACTGEEGNGEGVREVISSGIKGDCNIFGEPSGLRNITVGYRGKLDFSIEVKTKGGHSGSPWLYENAIEACFDIFRQAKNTLESAVSSADRFHSVTASVNLVRGGQARNITPSRCKMHVDVRLPPGLSPQKAMQMLEGMRMNILGKSSSEVTLRFSDDGIESYETDRSSLSLRPLMRSILQTVGGPVRLIRKTGTGDMNLFATVAKAQAVSYGPGDASLSHTDNEWVEANEYLASVRVIANAIRQFAYLYAKGDYSFT